MNMICEFFQVCFW